MEESPGSSVMLTPVSETSTLELAALLSPQVSPASQVSESTSDTSAAENPGPAFEPGSQEATKSEGEPRTEGDKDPKKNKQHLHCPVCKVTVNSTSQLEAHNSGTFTALFQHWGSPQASCLAAYTALPMFGKTTNKLSCKQWLYSNAALSPSTFNI